MDRPGVLQMISKKTKRDSLEKLSPREKSASDDLLIASKELQQLGLLDDDDDDDDDDDGALKNEGAKDEADEQNSEEPSDEKKQQQQQPCNSSSSSSLQSGARDRKTSSRIRRRGSAVRDWRAREEADGAVETLPWHHYQLYDLMGKEADYFLYPKLDMDKRTAKPLNVPLKNNQGFNSVDTLWAALRQNSDKKLENRDIPEDLKATYRAFIRKHMKEKAEVEDRDRLQWASAEVPEIDLLLDDSCQRKTLERRRKVQVMFRSSRKNQDRTQVLLFNNPIPDMNNWSGQDSIFRFLVPPEAPSETKEKELLSLPGIKEPYPVSLQVCGAESDAEYGSESARAYPHSETSSDSGRDEYVYVDPENKRNRYRCVFLTEADAVAKYGTFSRKRKELMEAKAVDTLYNQQTHLDQQKQITEIAPYRKSNAGNLVSVESKAKTPPQPPSVSCQPLTLAALMEYTASYSVPGQGTFKHGSSPMWMVQ